MWFLVAIKHKSCLILINDFDCVEISRVSGAFLAKFSALVTFLFQSIFNHTSGKDLRSSGATVVPIIESVW